MKKKIGLVWLNHDLRLHDNATLTHAASQCDELMVMTATYDFPRHRGQPYHVGQLSNARNTFLQETLTDLDFGLKQLGNRLFFLDKVSLKSLCQFIANHAITDVFYSRTADYDHQLRLDAVAVHLPNLIWHDNHTATLFARQPMDELPTTFTKFRLAVEASMFLLCQESDVAHTSVPNRLPPLPQSFNSTAIFTSTRDINAMSDTFVGGEAQAMAHLDRYFTSEASVCYKDTRNALDDWSASTKFSAWLANGSLSVNVLLNRLRQFERNVIANDSTYWIWFELLWREYFHWYAVEHGKKLFTINGISSKKRAPCFYPERYERWKNGNTPFPIVNACMNQLRTTGYMSNRGRQLVASCFIHELGMDWRYGASFFEQQLIDYDVASNWGNWQYLAGVGADPRGGRQFNLEKQTQQYDPDGTFIEKWRGDVGETRIDSVDAADWPV